MAIDAEEREKGRAERSSGQQMYMAGRGGRLPVDGERRVSTERLGCEFVKAERLTGALSTLLGVELPASLVKSVFEHVEMHNARGLSLICFMVGHRMDESEPSAPGSVEDGGERLGNEVRLDAFLAARCRDDDLVLRWKPNRSVILMSRLSAREAPEVAMRWRRAWAQCASGAQGALHCGFSSLGELTRNAGALILLAGLGYRVAELETLGPVVCYGSEGPVAPDYAA